MLEEYLLKVVIIGQSSVGKTSLLLQYTDGQFNEEHRITIGVDFRVKKLDRDDCLATLQLWDTAGQDRFRSIVSTFYRGAMGLIIVFDLTDLTSFERVPDWIEEASRYGNEDCVKILVGNKTDLISERQVDKAAAQALADRYNMQYIETSAKEARNVHAVFDSMADTLIQSKRAHGYIGGHMAESFRLDSAKDLTEVDYSCLTGRGYCY